MAKDSLMAQVAASPAVFAIGVGIANGVLAAVRNKPITARAAYATAVVLAAGEAILIMDLPDTERPEYTPFIVQTALGVLLGISPFVSWNGEKPPLQRIGEAIANRASAAKEAKAAA